MVDYTWTSAYRMLVDPDQIPPDGFTPVPQIIATDGGPWAVHNVTCSVCGERKAVLDLSLGVFIPCDKCKHEGWVLKKTSPRWYRFKKKLKEILWI